MKKHSSKLLGLLLLFAVVAAYISTIVAAHAVTVYVGSLTTVNATTYNSSGASFSVLSPNPGTFSVTDNGLTQTTAATVNHQWSIDNTNWITDFTWQAAVTNAMTTNLTPGAAALTLYQRWQVVTTNSSQWGIFQ